MKRQAFFQTFRREEGVADRVREQADELQMEESLAVQKQEEAAHAREEAKKDGPQAEGLSASLLLFQTLLGLMPIPCGSLELRQVRVMCQKFGE